MPGQETGYPGSAVEWAASQTARGRHAPPRRNSRSDGPGSSDAGVLGHSQSGTCCFGWCATRQGAFPASPPVTQGPNTPTPTPTVAIAPIPIMTDALASALRLARGCGLKAAPTDMHIVSGQLGDFPLPHAVTVHDDLAVYIAWLTTPLSAAALLGSGLPPCNQTDGAPPHQTIRPSPRKSATGYTPQSPACYQFATPA